MFKIHISPSLSAKYPVKVHTHLHIHIYSKPKYPWDLILFEITNIFKTKISLGPDIFRNRKYPKTSLKLNHMCQKSKLIYLAATYTWAGLKILEIPIGSKSSRTQNHIYHHVYSKFIFLEIASS